MSQRLVPPPLSPDSLYASNYCEENIYHLADLFLKQPHIKDVWDVSVVFISNEAKAVALWNQKLGGSTDYAIVWDYHVVLILRPRSEHVAESQTADLIDTSERGIKAWIYDFDTLLPKPCPWSDYVSMTFRGADEVPPQFRSLFRVIPAEIFLSHFASDRSHMLAPLDWPGYKVDAPYRSPLPPWPAIRGPKADQPNNLMSNFVRMSSSSETFDSAGVVQDRIIFENWCSRHE